MFWQGKFDADGNPTLTFRISADSSTPGVEVTAIIDTGFTGFVLVPMQYQLSLGLTPKSTTRLKLADDSVCIGVLADAYVSLDENTGRSGVVTLESKCKEILIGMDFLRQFGFGLAIFSDLISLIDEARLKGIIDQAGDRRLNSDPNASTLPGEQSPSVASK